MSNEQMDQLEARFKTEWELIETIPLEFEKIFNDNIEVILA